MWPWHLFPWGVGSVSCPLSPNPWTWIDLCDCLGKKIMAELLLCDFWASIIRIPCASAWLLWGACSWNLVTTQWRSQNHPTWRGHMESPVKVTQLTAQLRSQLTTHIVWQAWAKVLPEDSSHHLSGHCPLWVFPAEVPGIVEQRQPLPTMPCPSSVPQNLWAW